jgi:hypothetical protein
VLVGCSAKYDQLSPADQLTLLQRMAAGQVVLDCALGCATQWGATRRTLKYFHDTSQWGALALNVMKIGFNDDLTWYYLGRAAEELSYLDAARIYYAASLGAPRCNGALFNNCDGFDLPADAQRRLGPLAGTRENIVAGGVPPSGALASKDGGPNAAPRVSLIGSAFFINGRGTLVTNAHVVSDCASVHISDSYSDSPALAVAQIDQVNDIALIEGPSTSNFLTLREGKPIGAGDSVVAIGFPRVFGFEAVTTGTVSALAGLRNDPARLQVTRPPWQAIAADL